MNTALMNEIVNASGRLEKTRLLKDVKDPRFLRWALDPSVTFKITVDEEELRAAWTNSSGTDATHHDAFWKRVDNLCILLSTRDLVGNEALKTARSVLLSAPKLDDLVWACRVMNKDLRCGVNVSTVTKAFPKLIEPFACMLAHPYDASKHFLEGSWMAQAKLDGLRMVVVNGVAYTRTGKVLESVGHILSELAPWEDFVFDGEVMGEGGFDAASGKTRKKGGGPDTSLVYHVFDMIPLDEWYIKNTSFLSSRLGNLSAIFLHETFNNVKVVPWVELRHNPSFEDITALRDSMIADGYEGVMLKNLNAPYAFKRSNDLLKYKFMPDADAVIVGCLEGTGKHKGKLGAFEIDYKGVVCKVGSGFSDAQREQFWSCRYDLLYRVVEVAYQNLSESGALRFPVFVRLRPDKDH